MLGRFCKAAHLPDRMAHNALRSLRMVLGLLGGFPEAWMRLHAPAHGLTSLQDMRAWQARPPRRSSRLFRRHRCNPAAEPKPAPANLSRTGSTCEPENRRTESEVAQFILEPGRLFTSTLRTMRRHWWYYVACSKTARPRATAGSLSLTDWEQPRAWVHTAQMIHSKSSSTVHLS